MAVVDDYAPYKKPVSGYGKNSLLHYHDTDLFGTDRFDTGSKWVPDTWKPAAWLPDLPFLSSTKQHHLPDGKRGRVLVTGGTGSLGIPLVDRLLKEGFAVTLHDLRDPLPKDTQYIRQRNPSATNGGRLAFVKGDIMSATHLTTLMKELTAPATTTKKGKAKSPAAEGSLRAGSGLVGVINLAGISRDVWCSTRVEECEKLNVVGTTNLFDTLATATESSIGKKPWFLHLSSLDVYAPSTKTVATNNLDELTSLGKSKLLTERELEKSYNAHIERLVSHEMSSETEDGIRTILLRPSTIYGSSTDIQDRLVPALVRNALADLPIQILHGNEQVDFLHIDDALDGFIGAVERLMGKEAASDVPVSDVTFSEEQMVSEQDASTVHASTGFELTEEDPVGQMAKRQTAISGPVIQSGPMFEVYDLVSGFTATPRQLLDMVMSLTQSVSPIQDFTAQPSGAKSVKLPLMALQVPDVLRSKLGFQAAVSLDQGIARYVSTVRTAFTDWAKDYLGAECPSSPIYGDPNVIHPADQRNQNMQRLAGCTANIGVNHEGWIHHVKCGDSSCTADNIKTSSFNWNQSIFTILPYGQNSANAAERAEEANSGANGKWGWAFGLLGTDSRKEGAANQPIRVQFAEKITNKVLGFTKKVTPEGKTQYVKLRLFDEAEANASENIVSVFEPRVRNFFDSQYMSANHLP